MGRQKGEATMIHATQLPQRAFVHTSSRFATEQQGDKDCAEPPFSVEEPCSSLFFCSEHDGAAVILTSTGQATVQQHHQTGAALWAPAASSVEVAAFAVEGFSVQCFDRHPLPISSHLCLQCIAHTIFVKQDWI
jgi:hypothetical protein